MRLFLLSMAFAVVSLASYGQSSVYNIQVNAASDGNTINLSAFRGKRVLIVAAASQDSGFIQYAELKKLYKLYADSLVILVVPTNSFNTEPSGNKDLATAYGTSPGTNFLITEKQPVTGANMHPLFAWLTSKTLNGRLSSEVSHAFQKYLIGRDGAFVGIYSCKMSPLNPVLVNAIARN